MCGPVGSWEDLCMGGMNAMRMWRVAFTEPREDLQINPLWCLAVQVSFAQGTHWASSFV